jgi:hypothetical protein
VSVRDIWWRPSRCGIAFPRTMLGEIETRYRINLARVAALVDVYRERAGEAASRRPVEIDLLRAAVVFLHASMEEVLRSALEWRWPETHSRELLEDVPVMGHRRGTKIALADLLPHRGMSIQDLIRASVEAHIERTSFNNLGEVKQALRRIGLDTGLVVAHETELVGLMARRHQIVHRADRHDERGFRHDAAVSLGHETVQRWFSAVEELCAAIVAGLGEVRHDV